MSSMRPINSLVINQQCFLYSRLNLGNSEILQKKYASIKMINPVFCSKSKVIGPFRIYRTWFRCKKFKTDTKKIPIRSVNKINFNKFVSN